MPLTILVVEDDEGTRISLQDYLELEGYLVVVAEDGWKALQAVSEFQPQLIITDISMPRIDGYAFLKSLRQQPAWRLLPVILLTARTATQSKVQGYQVGCDVYIEKPFELDEIGAVVKNLLARSQLIQTAWMQYQTLPEPVPPADQTPTIPNEPLEPVLNFSFTDRERSVLDLLTEGMSNAQIAATLFLSPRTIEKYVTSLLRKTDTSNRAELVRFAMDHHLVD
ncbi:response regulator transcription factor [Oscillatoria sp. CS-180]|uniref:response regulator transcription factor n=1 Tax=Oscillatoria sp. CS-180 TaxID=3021720 RepID=UPI00232AB0B9|nr:response regulator transcription factor [Oscillatoria sp. CS-180]MDB9528554.1 response regulator transcription factor [Oscillatoria sp. CS-180]